MKVGIEIFFALINHHYAFDVLNVKHRVIILFLLADLLIELFAPDLTISFIKVQFGGGLIIP